MQKHETETKKVSGRIIKFRAWDEEKREMFEVSGMRWKDGMVTGDDTWYGDDFLAPALRISSTLMQYTGLKDKNGVEIYEGDIVSDDKQRYEIVYHLCGFTAKNTDSKTAVPASLEFLRVFAEARFEVIGNIYEHMHLLKND